MSDSELSPLESFLHLRVKNPAGHAIADPEELTPALVSLLHDVVPEVTEYRPEALEALDRYFAAEPPREGFTAQYLFEEFIPAVGAYLGAVIKRQLHGAWVRRGEVLKSGVRVGNREIAVFTEAFEAVYHGERLADAFRAARGDEHD